MKLRILTVEGESSEISAEEVREIVPFQSIFLSSHLKKPYVGAIVYHGNILPVLGPVPHLWNSNGSYEERPWLLVLKEHACVIHGLPQILEQKAERSNLEEEILQLEKNLSVA